VTRGLADVRNFTSDNLLLDLGDGIVIRRRNFANLTTLGFVPSILERLSEDWRGFGASSFVLVAEHSILKQPDNIITLDAGMVWTKPLERSVHCVWRMRGQSASVRCGWFVRPDSISESAVFSRLVFLFPLPAPPMFGRTTRESCFRKFTVSSRNLSKRAMAGPVGTLQ